MVHRKKTPIASGRPFIFRACKPKVELPPYDPRRREFRILGHVRVVRKRSGNYWTRCPSSSEQGRDQSEDNLAISVADPRKYKCWAGCTKEMIREALGQPIRMDERVNRYSCSRPPAKGPRFVRPRHITWDDLGPPVADIAETNNSRCRTASPLTNGSKAGLLKASEFS